MNILLPCCKKKCLTPARGLDIQGYDKIPQKDLQWQWLKALNQTTGFVPARALYTGKLYATLADVLPKFPLFIYSGGLGLVHQDTLVPGYELSLDTPAKTRGGMSSVRRYIQGRFQLVEWWGAITNGPFSGPIPKGPTTMVIPSSYVEVANIILSEMDPRDVRLVAHPYCHRDILTSHQGCILTIPGHANFPRRLGPALGLRAALQTP